uniref:Putative guanylate-kinase-associated protein n=1 Tax=Rhipicephalus pulchellus TaxID=72859 RepID=L7M2B9_RHIPC
MALTPAHFRGLVEEETKRLTSTCHHWECVVATQPDISEEAQGYIRSATGKAKLLMNERFSQFTRLIHNCENNLGEKKTTCEDLQGFWDMVYFQVEDVNKNFDQLAKMQENAWELHEKADVDKANMPRVGSKTTSVKAAKPVATKGGPTEAQKARIAASRKRLAEAKARMANTVTAEAPAVTADKENVVLFEAPNFFLVSSPARSKQNKPRCPQGTPRSLKKTPKQKDFSPLACVTRSAKKALLQHN